MQFDDNPYILLIVNVFRCVISITVSIVLHFMYKKKDSKHHGGLEFDGDELSKHSFSHYLKWAIFLAYQRQTVFLK